MILKRKTLKNYSQSVSSLSSLYILSAVRTPLGLLNGMLNEFTAPELGSFAIKEALLRAVVPSKDLQNAFLGCVSHSNCQEEIKKRTGLSNVSLVESCGMKSLFEAVKFLLRRNHKVCIAGGMVSVTNPLSVSSQFFQMLIKNAHKDRKELRCNLLGIQEMNKYMKRDYNNFLEAKRNGALCEEILKIDFRKRGQHIVVAEDEILRENCKGDSFLPPPGDGAVAVTISTEDYFTDNSLTPLAKIISYAEEFASRGDLAAAQLLAIERALKAAECECEEINRWEVVSTIHDIICCKNYFNIDSSQINRDGGILSLGYPVGMSGVRAICHLVHSLSTGELGCAVACDFSGTASAVIIKKLRLEKSCEPRLTLYTKYPCPLCDELKEQLIPFEGRFSLAEVDIEAEESRKYKELFQYEIPVLFLDGIFLCKHQLDVEHFNQRLLASEKNFA